MMALALVLQCNAQQKSLAHLQHTWEIGDSLGGKVLFRLFSCFCCKGCEMFSAAGSERPLHLSSFVLCVSLSKPPKLTLRLQEHFFGSVCLVHYHSLFPLPFPHSPSPCSKGRSAQKENR